MRDFLKVFNFENKVKFKQKSYVISLVLTFLIVFALTFIPTIISKFDEGRIEHSTQSEKINPKIESENVEKVKVLAFFAEGTDKDLIAFINNHYIIKEVKTEEELEKEYEEDKYSFALSVKGIKDISTFSKKSDVLFKEIKELEYLLTNFNMEKTYKELGITPEGAMKLNEIEINVEFQSLGKNLIASTIFANIGIFAIYFLVIFFGNSISLSTCREKESRTMELLITNVKAKYLLLGKVFSGVFLSFLQIILMFLAIALGIYVNSMLSKSILTILVGAIKGIGALDVIIFLIFSIIGTTLYYLLFAALSSLVSKVEEIQSAITPVTLLIVISFMGTMFNISNPTGNLMYVLSFIPFTSPLAMFTRFVISDVPVMELLISILILIVSTVLIAILSIKIYRLGTLNYGNKMSIRALLKRMSNND